MKEGLWLVAIAATILAAADLGATHQHQRTIPTECPADDPFDTTVLLAHESDCSKFYVCFLGEKILKDCPYENNKGDRLHFNPFKQVCDYPADAGCLTPSISGKKLITPAAKQLTNKADTKLTPLVTLLTTPRNIPSSLINSSNVIKYKPHQCEYNLYYKIINGNEILDQCENNFHWNQELEDCYKPDETECTAKGISVTYLQLPFDVSCIDGEFYIHECSCVQYYQCVSGNKVLKSCEKGLYWGQQQRKCTTPEEANCPHEKPKECTEGSTKPHPCECNLYYKCINGQYILRECPDGLHWSKDRQICTTPEDAKCIKICDEGSYKPHATECSQYYKCTNNSWNLQQCPNGLHWSKDQQICTTPEDAKCIKICDEGSYKPHEKECSQYYKCSDNRWNLQQCPDGLHWSKDRQICTTPEDAKCIKICEEGSYKPHEKECSQYYKCSDNRWNLQQCPTGLHWSKDQQICTTPEDAKCIKICEEDSFRPHESDCNLYYKCRNNGWSLRQCPDGLHWSKDRQICTTPEDAKCIKICEEGSYKPHEKECSQYYKCSDNRWNLQQCPDGLHWSKDRQICTTPEDAKCIKICEEGSYKPHEKECSQYYKCSDNRWNLQQCPTGLHWSKDQQICTTPEDAKCIKICEEGSYKPHEKECSQYYKCSDNRWNLQQCPDGLHWSKDRQICTTPEDAKCIKICEEDSFRPHESDCNLYYKCRNNGWSLRQCPDGLHWSKDRQICTTPEDAKCIKICDEGKHKPDDDKCEVYYECKDNRWELKYCPGGLHWDRVRDTCSTPESANCPWDCKEGSFLPHECECNIYYKCINYRYVRKVCQNGLHWDRTHNNCTSPEQANCPNYHPKICEEGSYKPDDKICEIYYKCENNQFVQKTCPAGLHWNRVSNICSDRDSAKCPNYHPKICEEGSYKPDDKICEIYYKCENNQFVQKTCPAGFHWNRVSNICTDPASANCPNAPRNCVEGSFKPHDCQCDIYYECQNNQYVQRKCVDGLHWDRTHYNCTLPDLAHCPNYHPKICDEGSTKPHNCKCNLYYKCINNQLVLKECENGLHWDRYNKLCALPDRAKCPNYHPKICDEGAHKADETECDIYYECQNNTYVKLRCSSGLHWDRTHNYCTTPDKANCPNYHPKICEEGTYKPDDKICEIYYKCENNQFVTKACTGGLHWNRIQNICTDPDSAKCPNYHPKICEEGTYKPDDNICEVYYRCENNQFVKKTCTGGLHWNRIQNICTDPDSAKCPNYHPKICEEGTYKPDDNICEVYYRCENNQFVKKTCTGGLHWNRIQNICTDPSSANCPNYHPKICDEGTYKPDDNICEVYYRCENNQFVKKTCTGGLHWNRIQNICTDPSSAKCPNYHPRVCEEGSYSPHECQCDAYYKCINNELILQYCPSGKYWKRTANICTDPSEANCQPKLTKACFEKLFRAKL